MIVMSMADNDGVYRGNVINVAGRGGISLLEISMMCWETTWKVLVYFRAHERKRTTSWLKYRIKEYSQASREFDIVTSMSQPCCS